MNEHYDSTTTSMVTEFVTEKYGGANVVVHPVEGGYSRNRRAIIDVGDKSFFAKEVDVNILPDEGDTELAWLKKDYGIITELGKHGVSMAPDWAELQLDGHLLLMPSYKKEDGWHWSVPADESIRTEYIQSVIDATKQLEATELSKDQMEKLSLDPFFRDEIANYEGIAPLFSDTALREQLIEKYSKLQENSGHLSPMAVQMVKTLSDDESLRDLQERTMNLRNLPNDRLNHCDVRSDNIAYNQKTGEVKFVDWNWASYAPAKFGATEFLLDMARRGVDVSPWHDDMSVDLLAATVGYYMIRSLKPPLTPGSTLREMQAETAAVANYLYRQLAK
jgi:hypothetical protein